MFDKLKVYYRYWFWALNIFFVRFYIRHKFNILLDKESDPVPRPPFIMVSNHGTFFDPWIIGHYSKYPISIMMNEDAYSASPFVHWFLNNIGTYPKKKGASDYKAMKNTLRFLRQGFPVLIFPEGQTTWDGETQPIYTGIEKILKKSKAALVMTKVDGNFISKPWWAATYRKGRVRILRKVILPDKIRNISEDELRTLIIDHIRSNDIKNKINQKVGFTGDNLAKGLEMFVWICKNCNSEDTLYTNKNTISCSNCNSSWTIDALCSFKPAQSDITKIGDLYDWSLWHKIKVREKIKNAGKDDILTESDGVVYCSLTKKGTYDHIADGRLALTKETFSFFGTKDIDQSFEIPVSDISVYVFQRKNIFECRDSKKSYLFRFTEKSLMKWVYYFRYLNGYEKFEKRGYI